MKMKRIPIINWLSEPDNLKLFRCHRCGVGLVLTCGAGQQIGRHLSDLDLPPPEVPQPQLFCGYCHVLTYPGVVQKGYELWKKGKHNKCRLC